MYPGIGGGEQAEEQLAMLWLLNQSDGETSLLEIAERSGLAFAAVARCAEPLVEARLLERADHVV